MNLPKARMCHAELGRVAPPPRPVPLLSGILTLKRAAVQVCLPRVRELSQRAVCVRACLRASVLIVFHQELKGMSLRVPLPTPKPLFPAERLDVV